MILIKKIILLADKCLIRIYGLLPKFPKEEKFNLLDQLRRASLSVILNLIEGHNRSKESIKSFKNFLSISFGSLSEVKYLVISLIDSK